MRHTWLPEDIEAGLFVIRNSAPKDSKDLGFMRTVTCRVFARTVNSKFRVR